MRKNISFRMWLSVFFGGIWQFICNIFSWKNKAPFWRVIWITNSVCAMALIFMFVSGWYKESRYRNSYKLEYTPEYEYSYEDVDSVVVVEEVIEEYNNE